VGQAGRLKKPEGGSGKKNGEGDRINPEDFRCPELGGGGNKRKLSEKSGGSKTFPEKQLKKKKTHDGGPRGAQKCFGEETPGTGFLRVPRGESTPADKLEKSR